MGRLDEGLVSQRGIRIPDSGRRRPDLSSGPIARTLFAIALPTFLTLLLQSLNTSVNSIWVGRLLGQSALAAISNANAILMIMIAAVFGLGMAATIMIGHAIGAGDVITARRITGTAAGLFAIGSVTISIAGWFLSDPILGILGTPESVRPLASAYLRMLFVGLPALFEFTLLSMSMRSAGDAVTPLLATILNVAIDGTLNPVLILGAFGAPKLGIAGSAASTGIACYAGLAILLAVIYLRDLPFRLRGREFRFLLPSRATSLAMLAKGVPISLQMFVASAAGFALVGMVNHAGVNMVAAFGLIMQLWAYMQLPAMAMSSAVSAMVAQSIGARRWDRVSAITFQGVIISASGTTLLILMARLIARQIFGFFLAGGEAVRQIAIHVDHLASWSLVMLSVTLVVFGAVRANGAVVAPLVIFTLAMLPVRFGAILVMRRWIGIDALWWSMPFSLFTSMVLTLGYYHNGSWRRT